MRRALPFTVTLTLIAAGCIDTPQPNAPPPAPPLAPVVMVAAPAPLPAAAAVPVAPPPASAGAAALAIVMQPPTPEPLAPPAIGRQPTTLALPDLPRPSSYPHVARIPFEREVTRCGSVWSGSEWVAAQCLDTLTQTRGTASAKVVVPYGLMKPGAVTLPSIVDHRLDGAEGPIRHQTGSQCSAFSFTAALDHAYALWAGKPGAFSVMQIWGRYHLKSEIGAVEGNIGDSVASEADWPYDKVTASSWERCPVPPYKLKPAGTCSLPVDQGKLSSLEPLALGDVTQIEVIPTAQLDVLREKLAGGQDVVVGLSLHSFATAGVPGAKYVVGDEEGKPKKGAHSHQILLVGYAMTPNGNYYLVHNSTGEKWGDHGYAWMHEDILRSRFIKTDMFAVDMQPREVAARRLRADGSLALRCAAGMVPDSISAACAPKCPDGSPRHNDVCALATSDCPAGTVNLTGMCVLAAPRSAGVDPATQVAWTCGAGGCSYVVPQGQLNCRDGVCAASCPAPMFRLATMPSGLACVE
jgi:hypothetical protein